VLAVGDVESLEGGQIGVGQLLIGRLAHRLAQYWLISQFSG
jgi:hypothetical protein